MFRLLNPSSIYVYIGFLNVCVNRTCVMTSNFSVTKCVKYINVHQNSHVQVLWYSGLQTFAHSDFHTLKHPADVPV